ncbi:hypothetical protein [Providencia sp. PROV174]|uniref:hypothetical protein n=1 Tax=Providencia sp. PROV174 TaxID=2949877 RepID=UPI00234A2F42|nr:hypothetical protein [Providencia sp. PROV174]
MSESKKENKEKKPKANESVEKVVTDEKTCFVIMPIADHPDYPKGHFNRVYEYLIKPACKNAGYKAIRADDSKASHLIMFDILQNIVKCDMAICDLTTKNANVFYELGLRQAFNKKTILITDGKERAPFDISAFRYITYSPTLRIDETTVDIANITSMLIETENAPESDVNSIVKLLEIEPAKIDYKALNSEESMFFKMLMGMNDKLESLSNDVYRKASPTRLDSELNKFTINYSEGDNNKLNLSLYAIINHGLDIYNYEYSNSVRRLGTVKKIDDDFIYFTPRAGRMIRVRNTEDKLRRIIATELDV